MTITVYTKPGCQPCRATKRWLDKRGVEYGTVDVTTSPADHPDNLTKYTLTEEAA